MLQRLVGHHRPEVGAADADVDDVANAFAGVAFPGAAAHAVGEISHLVEHGVDLRHHVLAIDDDRCASRRAQGHVQDGAVFRDVDLLAPEHGVDPRAQSGFLRQLQEELEGFVGDAILRVVQIEAHALRPSCARRVWDHPQKACADAARGHFDGERRGHSMPDAPRVVLLLGSSLSSFHSVLVVHCYPCVPSLVPKKRFTFVVSPTSVPVSCLLSPPRQPTQRGLRSLRLSHRACKRRRDRPRSTMAGK